MRYTSAENHGQGLRIPKNYSRTGPRKQSRQREPVSSGTFLPAVRVAARVIYGDDGNASGSDSIEGGVGEPAEEYSPEIFEDEPRDEWYAFDRLKRDFHLFDKFLSQTLAPIVVPLLGAGQIGFRLGIDDERTIHDPPINRVLTSPQVEPRVGSAAIASSRRSNRLLKNPVES